MSFVLKKTYQLPEDFEDKINRYLDKYQKITQVKTYGKIPLRIPWHKYAVDFFNRHKDLFARTMRQIAEGKLKDNMHAEISYSIYNIARRDYPKVKSKWANEYMRHTFLLKTNQFLEEICLEVKDGD